MEDGSCWTPKDRKTETEMEWCYKKTHEGETSKYIIYTVYNVLYVFAAFGMVSTFGDCCVIFMTDTAWHHAFILRGI